MLREVQRGRVDGIPRDITLATRTARALKREGRWNEVGHLSVLLGGPPFLSSRIRESRLIVFVRGKDSRGTQDRHHSTSEIDLQAIKLYEEVVDAFDKNYDADDVSSLSAKINFAVLLRQVSTFGIVVYQYDSVHHNPA